MAKWTLPPVKKGRMEAPPMSDDLKERLRALDAITMPGQPFTLEAAQPWLQHNTALREEAAARIEALEAQLSSANERARAAAVLVNERDARLAHARAEAYRQALEDAAGVLADIADMPDKKALHHDRGYAKGHEAACIGGAGVIRSLPNPHGGGWHDMESAPDFTGPVLLYFGNIEWHDGNGNPTKLDDPVHEYACRIYPAFCADGRIYEAHTGHDIFQEVDLRGENLMPTRWRPLPPAPEGGEGQDRTPRKEVAKQPASRRPHGRSGGDRRG